LPRAQAQREVCTLRGGGKSPNEAEYNDHVHKLKSDTKRYFGVSYHRLAAEVREISRKYHNGGKLTAQEMMKVKRFYYLWKENAFFMVSNPVMPF
jgi:hypothetical protein